MAKADWVAIKTEYITTRISYTKLSEKYGINASVIMTRAAKEKWVDAKKKNHNKTVEKAIRKASAKQVNVLAKELMLADKLSDVLNRALKDADQFNRYVVTEGCGMGESEVSEKIFDKIDMKALRDAAATLKIIEDMKRSMNNILTEPEKQKMEIEREKLAMEKAKIVGLDDEDDNTGVVVLAEILEEEEDEVQSGTEGQQICDSEEAVVQMGNPKG